MKRKIIPLIFIAVCIFQTISFAQYNDTEAEVFVTVTDISDSENPLNILVERQAIKVKNFDISKYGDEFSGIPILDSGVTYLHAILQLHENLYGEENVKENFWMDSQFVTHIFMGKSVTSIMYKNGKDIFAYPQYINIHDGDEINICLYNEGHSQMIASFNEVYMYAAPGDVVTLNLFEHNVYPQISNPIYGAQITDENGVYITDGEDNIISSDVQGNFSVAFEDTGEHKITIAPQLNYYLSSDGGTNIVWYEKGLVAVPTEEWENKTVFALDWNSKESVDFEEYKDSIYTEEIIKKEEFIAGQAELMCQYTVPWVIVNVTNDLFFVDVTQVSNMVKFRIRNSGNYTGTVYCAGYKSEENCERMVCMKSSDISEYQIFTFDNTLDVDYFKILAWDGNMIPLCEAYIQSDAVTLEWNKTMTEPENVLISGQN